MSGSVRVRLMTLLWLAAVTACSCDTTPIQHSSGSLSVNKSLDFHKVCIGDTASFPLALQNTGRGVLTVSKLDLSGKDAARFSLEMPPTLPTTIASNSSLVLNIDFKATVGGMAIATLTITSDDKEAPTQKITLLATGDNGERLDFEIACDCNRNSGPTECGLPMAGDSQDNPCTLLTFDDVPDGTYLDRTVHLTNNGCALLTVSPQVYDDAMYDSLFSVQQAGMPVSSSITLHGGESQDVQVRFAPTGKDEVVPTSRLKFVSNDTTVRNGQTTAGTWDLGLIANSTAPSLVVSVDKLAFFDASVGHPSSKTFTVSNVGSGMLHVDSITVAGGPDYQLQLANGESSFTLAPTGDASHGDSRMETITFSPTASTPSSENATITIKAGQQTAEIQLFGGAQPQMTVQWTADGMTYNNPPIDFGSTPTGAMGLTRTVRLSNVGSAPLKITSVATRDVSNTNPSASFSIPPFTATTLMPNDQVTVVVTFNDVVSVQNDSGKLAIGSNDPTDSMSPNHERVADIISLNSANFPPTANFNVSAAPETCHTLTLDASPTTDVENDAITYKWTIVKKPTGSSVTLENDTAQKTRILNAGSPATSCMSTDGPDVPGTYIFKLTVADQQYPTNTTSATQTVNVQ